jgi:hypothetical protein
MVALEFCQECKELLKIAREATYRHIQSVSRLQIARINGDEELATAFLVVMKEAAETRERVTLEYQVHRLRYHALAQAPLTPQRLIPERAVQDKQNVPTLPVVH